jgi:large subunit ribosomal protein L5
VSEPTTKPRLQELWETELVGQLAERFSIGSRMAVPRLERIAVNIGLGAAVQEPKLVETAVAEMTVITGQKPIVTRARKAIANFKLREGMPIGVAATLRRHRMYEFLDRLVNVALPRVRDFRGLSPRAFDGHGNYTMGIREQVIFPEIDLDKVDKVLGLSITMVTTTDDDERSLALLAGLGVPFRT